MHISTIIAADSIITKFRAHNEEYTLFTGENGTNKYKTNIIKFSDYKNVLWTVEADTTIGAAVTHVALFNMANEHSVLQWNEKIFDANKHKQIVDALKLKNALAFAKDNTLNSAFTSHLCKAAGMDLTHTEMEMSNSKIIGWIAGFAIVLLTMYGFLIDM